MLRGHGSIRLHAGVLGCVLAGLLVFAAPASATFHLMKIREVYPAGDASYVELQMLDNGEYQVGGHHLVIYKTNGEIAEDYTLPNNGSPSSRTNSTILIAGPGYATAFPSGPTPDEADSSLTLSASGGAVCWVEGEPPDCVAWGNFTGPLPAHNPPLLVGNPASPGGVTAGKALRRSIAAGCNTALEAGDDTDDSATDFSEQTPHPRDNASPVEESACVLPEVDFEIKPASPTRSTSAEFLFTSTPEGALFECKLDTGPYEPCSHPDEEPLLLPGPFADGSHTFQVVAINSKGKGVPRGYTWLVDTVAPTVSLTAKPANPSTGATATFAYEASQLGSTFECTLVAAGGADSFAACPAGGQSYADLADGNYAFKVRATDKAGNQGAPTVYEWTVNNSLNTPPVVPPSTGSTPPPTTTPPPVKKLVCKKGFVKKKVKGKTRCVKKAKKKKKKH